MPEFHLPRLARTGLRRILDQLPDLGAATWHDRHDLADRWISWGNLGAPRATTTQIDDIRTRIVAVAEACGFPESDAVRARSRFDGECAILLARNRLVPETEALRDDVWSWMAAVLLPDVALWRYGAVEARFRGGVRNTFQRLWLRGTALDRGDGDDQARWELVRALTEDAMVQIFERPGLSGSVRIARAIGERWLLVLQARGPRGLEDIARRATMGLSISNQVVSLESLGDQLLSEQVERQFAIAVAAADG